VHGEEVGALSLDERRPPAPGIVALPGLLDLHDVGPRVRQGLRAVRPGQDPGEVDDAHAGERVHEASAVANDAGNATSRSSSPGAVSARRWPTPAGTTNASPAASASEASPSHSSVAWPSSTNANSSSASCRTARDAAPS